MECLTRDQGVVGLASSEALCCILVPCLVLVQHRKTHSDMNEKMLTGTLKESNQTNKKTINKKLQS